MDDENRATATLTAAFFIPKKWPTQRASKEREGCSAPAGKAAALDRTELGQRAQDSAQGFQVARRARWGRKGPRHHGMNCCVYYRAKGA